AELPTGLAAGFQRATVQRSELAASTATAAATATAVAPAERPTAAGARLQAVRLRHGSAGCPEENGSPSRRFLKRVASLWLARPHNGLQRLGEGDCLAPPHPPQRLAKRQSAATSPP